MMKMAWLSKIHVTGLVTLGVALGVCLLPAMAVDEAYSAKVVSVLDGDTLEVEHEGARGAVFLHGSDAPELPQPFGPEARAFTEGLVNGKTVEVQEIEQDARGRLLVRITLEDGRSLNHELVVAGLAWYCPDHKPSDADLLKLSVAAMKEKAGLWEDAAPLAPWDFRSREKEVHPVAEAASAEAASEDGTSAAAGLENDPRPVFICKGNGYYHRVGCVDLDKTRRVITLGEAVALGYTPCIKCLPPKIGEQKAKVLEQKGDLEEAVRPVFPKMAEIENNPIYQQAQPRWHRDANGKVQGITAENIASIPFASALGFQDGDVLTSVNGNPITSEAQIMDMVEKFKNTKSFSVGVLRNGRPTKLNVTIPF